MKLTRDKIDSFADTTVRLIVHKYLGGRINPMWKTLIPKYEQNLNADSDKLFKELKKNFFRASVVLNDFDDNWVAYLERRSGDGESMPYVLAKANTPALALCRAYLYWKLLGD